MATGSGAAAIVKRPEATRSQRTPAPITNDVSLRRKWTTAFVVGELIGFVPPAVTGAALAAMKAPDVVMVLGLTAAGLAEGAAIGEAQARVLNRVRSGIDGQAWRVATIAAAGFAWLVGMGGGTVMGRGSAPGWMLFALAPMWVAALLAMGGLQWLVMRRTIPGSVKWVPVTAVAWLVGVAMPVIALSIVPSGWPLWTHAVVGVVAAVAMGLTVGVMTGQTLVHLLRARQ